MASFHAADVKESSLEQSEVNGSSSGVDCCFEGNYSDAKSEISITHLAALLAAISLNSLASLVAGRHVKAVN